MSLENRRKSKKALTRGPIGKSCLECRRRKVKCDLTEPCRRCRIAQRRCHYAAPTRNEAVEIQPVEANGSQHGSSEGVAGPSTAPRPTTTRASHQWDSNAQASGSTSRWRTVAETRPIERPYEPPNTDIETSDSDAAPATANHARDVGRADDGVRLRRDARSTRTGRALPTTAPFQAVPPDVSLSSFRLRDGRATLNKTRLFGRSHWDSTNQEFGSLQAVFNLAVGKTQWDSQTQHSISDIRSLSDKCKALSRQSKQSQLRDCVACSDSGLQVPPQQVARELATLYVTRFESAFRILHIPSFWKHFENHWQAPFPSLTSSSVNTIQLQLLLAMAIGTSLYRGDQVKREDLSVFASNTVHLAEDWLARPLGKNQLTIGGLQVQCLLILARHTLPIGSYLAWISIGGTLRTAMQMGLHRDPQNFPQMPVLEAELRRRLWATIVELNVQSSLGFGMPSMLSMDDFDTQAPSDINDTDMNETTQVLSHENRAKDVSDTHVQLILWSSLRSRLAVIKCLNGLSEDLSYEEVLDVTHDIDNACRKVSKVGQQQIQNDQRDYHSTGAFRRNYAEYLLRRFLLPLHRPFSRRSSTSPLLQFSKKVSLDTALAIILPGPDDEFSHFLQVSGGPISYCLHHASLVLALELIADLEDSSQNAHLASVISRRDVLIDALKTAIAIEERRLQHSENNVKLHMWLSMVMGHVEAVIEDLPVHDCLLQKAKESLENSYLLLLNRSLPAMELFPWQDLDEAGGLTDILSIPLEWSGDLAEMDPLHAPSSIDFLRNYENVFQ